MFLFLIDFGPFYHMLSFEESEIRLYCKRNMHIFYHRYMYANQAVVPTTPRVKALCELQKLQS